MVIKAKKDKKVILNLIMSNIFNNSFSYVNIYEYNGLYNLYYNKKTTQNVKDEIKGDDIEIPISYEVTNSSTNYIFIEYFPIKEISKMTVNLNIINKTIDENNKEKNNNFNIYYIIIPLLIIIILIIIFIIVCVIRKNKISSKDIENASKEPLFSEN